MYALPFGATATTGRAVIESSAADRNRSHSGARIRRERFQFDRLGETEVSSMANRLG
jgi:hypothetical protein